LPEKRFVFSKEKLLAGGAIYYMLLLRPSAIP